MAIHRQLHFIFKIRLHRAQTTNQDIRLSVAGEWPSGLGHLRYPGVRSLLRQRHVRRGEHGFLAGAGGDMK